MRTSIAQLMSIAWSSLCNHHSPPTLDVKSNDGENENNPATATQPERERSFLKATSAMTYLDYKSLCRMGFRSKKPPEKCHRP